MTVPRRNIIRPTSRPSSNPSPRVTKINKQLEDEKSVLKRWMSRLRRAFNAVEKSQRRIQRMERALAQTEAAS